MFLFLALACTGALPGDSSTPTDDGVIYWVWDYECAGYYELSADTPPFRLPASGTPLFANSLFFEDGVWHAYDVAVTPGDNSTDSYAAMCDDDERGRVTVAYQAGE